MIGYYIIIDRLPNNLNLDNNIARINTDPNAICSYCGKVRKRYFTTFIDRDLYYSTGNRKRRVTLCLTCYHDRENSITNNNNNNTVLPSTTTANEKYEQNELLASNMRARESSTMDEIMNILVLAYESILQVIKNITALTNNQDIEFYNAVRIAYQNYPYLKKYLNVDQVININKIYYRSNDINLLNSFLNDDNRRLWKFKYELVYNEPRVVIISKEPLRLRWTQNSKTIFDTERERKQNNP
jgi:cytochrome c553